MSRILVTVDGLDPQEATTLYFSGGEVNPQIQELPKWRKAHYIKVKAHIDDALGIMDLLMVNDALRRKYGRVPRDLLLPYLPYSRHDRIFNVNQGLGVAVFADLINSMHFDTVTTWDAHSDVGPALIRNCRNIPVEKLMMGVDTKGFCIFAPDAGAYKKCHKVAEEFNTQLAHATKIRDVETGRIKAVQVHNKLNEVLTHVLVVDDICDGGATFLLLAEELKRQGCQVLHLWVTHGIFSKGVSELVRLYDRIYTTNSFANSVAPVRVIEH